MSDEKREDLVVDLRGALGVLELSQTAGPFKADARDVAKKLASLQPILTRSGEWIDKCCNAAKKIGEATQDARERLADLECRIATLENAVAELNPRYKVYDLRLRAGDGGPRTLSFHLLVPRGDTSRAEELCADLHEALIRYPDAPEVKLEITRSYV